MKLANKIIAAITTAIGVFFLFNAFSDIQLGFGLTLVALGLLNLTNRK